MKKIGITLLILALLISTCVFALVSCSDVTQSISYNNVIESKYGDSFITLETHDAPAGALEYASTKRVTRKYLIDGRVIGRHTLGLYIPREEDVTITTDKTYAEILKELQDKYPEAMITPGVIYQAPGQRTRNLTFHLEF